VFLAGSEDINLSNKQSDAKEMERWCLVRATQDEDLRRRLAVQDKSSFVRAEAIRHITDQEFLDPSPEVRAAAIRRINSPDRIKELALRETNGSLQYHLLYDIRDTDVIAHYAKSAVLLETREKAVKLLEDQTLLYKIFIKAERLGNDEEKYEWRSLACAAFERITDTAILLSIARDKKRSGTYRKWAMMHIKSTALCEELIMDDFEAVAAYAAANVKSQDVLMKAVYHHTNPNVRYKAMCGLDEQGLTEVIEIHPDRGLRPSAVNMYHNMPQSMAIRLALEDPVPAVRTAAIYRVNSRAVLLFSAMNDPCDTPALIAYERLKDMEDEVRWRIIEEAVSREPRLMAIRFCRNKEMLMSAAQNDPDEEIRQRADERLKNKMYDEVRNET